MQISGFIDFHWQGEIRALNSGILVKDTSQTSNGPRLDLPLGISGQCGSQEVAWRQRIMLL